MRRSVINFLALALIAVQCATMCQCRFDHVAHQDACGHERLHSDVAMHDDVHDHCGDHDAVKRPNPLPAPVSLACDQVCFAAGSIASVHRPSPLVTPPRVVSAAIVLPLLI